MCWRLRLSEFDFTVTYRPALLHEVPDALWCALTLDGNDDKPIDDEVPTYGDHESVFVTNRQKAANSTPNQPATTMRERITRKRTARTPTDAGSMSTKGTANLTDEERLLTDFQQNCMDKNTTKEDEAICGIPISTFSRFTYTYDTPTTRPTQTHVYHER